MLRRPSRAARGARRISRIGLMVPVQARFAKPNFGYRARRRVLRMPGHKRVLGRKRQQVLPNASRRRGWPAGILNEHHHGNFWPQVGHRRLTSAMSFPLICTKTTRRLTRRSFNSGYFPRCILIKMPVGPIPWRSDSSSSHCLSGISVVIFGRLKPLVRAG